MGLKIKTLKKTFCVDHTETGTIQVYYFYLLDKVLSPLLVLGPVTFLTYMLSIEEALSQTIPSDRKDLWAFRRWRCLLVLCTFSLNLAFFSIYKIKDHTVTRLASHYTFLVVKRRVWSPKPLRWILFLNKKNCFFLIANGPRPLFSLLLNDKILMSSKA